MENVDASERAEQQSSSVEQTPSLLTVILDTNPAAWALLSEVLPLSKAVADLLVFINAHLACNYTNKVAVIASHSDKAQWLYPTPVDQSRRMDPPSAIGLGHHHHQHHHHQHHHQHHHHQQPSHNQGAAVNSDARHRDAPHAPNGDASRTESNKYRPFRLVEEQLTENLTTLLTSTEPSAVSSHSSTMVAGALTLALSYINRETIAYNESLTGKDTAGPDAAGGPGTAPDAATANNTRSNGQQSRILLLTVSPSTDLAHQYIPIMNSIFACLRMGIPIDVLQLPLPSSSASRNQATGASGASSTSAPSSNSSVFLQQAADATRGIFISANLTPTSRAGNPASRTQPNSQQIVTSIAASSLLTYLLTAFLPSPNTRRNLILPTRIDVDFRAACFCHRNIISIGFVCSICLSIFCSVPEDNICLTCGTPLSVSGSGYGARPVVVPKKKKKKQPQ